VALDFAAVDGAEIGLSPEPGEAFIAREDLEALDLLPGTAMKVYRADKSGEELSLKIQQGKRLPRRVIVLSPEDRAKLAVSLAGAGIKIPPNDVPRLNASERVTVESPSASAPGADAFRWFFLAGNPPWSPTRHSLGNVRAIQKEFPLKLRNVYSFFTIYANIDGFDPAQHKGRPIAERPLLDRWILSELAILERRVPEFMDNFRAYESAGALTDFVDGLSNWYLRRSRERFWRAEFDASKQDAYSTLYECLVAVAKLAAPFVPFMAEEIYQNIVGRTGGDSPLSVHLCDLPVADESRIDRELSDRMAIVRNIVSLGLATLPSSWG
jgi:isoleucyl-tRNA synthetase